VDPVGGAVTRIAGGLVSPVGLAIASDGTAYVSMLFAGLLMKQELGGRPVPFAEVTAPGDVELHGDYLYVTETDLTGDPAAPPAGKVLRLPTAD
jgi:hypothetical protein